PVMALELSVEMEGRQNHALRESVFHVVRNDVSQSCDDAHVVAISSQARGAHVESRHAEVEEQHSGVPEAQMIERHLLTANRRDGCNAIAIRRQIQGHFVDEQADVADMLEYMA